MSTRKLRTVENLIMLAFPIVLFAGCAGNDVKPVLSEPDTLTISQKTDTEQVMDITSSADEPELPIVSEINADIPGDNSIPAEQIKPGEQSGQLALNENPETEKISTEIVLAPDKMIFFFDTDIHMMTNEQREELRQHADYLLANPGIKLVINGHADERGSESYNQQLSEKRARATLDILLELGVPETQLLVQGFGELVPMNEENNWEENRRVELLFNDTVMLSSM